MATMVMSHSRLQIVLLKALTEYYVVITATDSVDAIGSSDITVPDPYSTDNSAHMTQMTRLKNQADYLHLVCLHQ